MTTCTRYMDLFFFFSWSSVAIDPGPASLQVRSNASFCKLHSSSCLSSVRTSPASLCPLCYLLFLTVLKNVKCASRQSEEDRGQAVDHILPGECPLFCFWTALLQFHLLRKLFISSLCSETIRAQFLLVPPWWPCRPHTRVCSSSALCIFGLS